MQTRFTPAQRADPDLRESEQILRACVHCGFCTATCPTYVLLGDERDSPRGRIYLIKEMLERGGPPGPATVRHIDRCLSCLACVTTCPSGVDYMHLVDHARSHIEQTYRRPWRDRLLRRLLREVLPHAGRARLALAAARLARPLSPLLPATLRRMVRMAPPRPAWRDPADRPRVFPAEGPRRLRVALLPGCVQRALAPEINAATIRLLTRHGVEVVVAPGSTCCGALSHHLGAHAPALQAARANCDAWARLIDAGGLDHVVVNASGCGTMVKDYGHLLAREPARADCAARLSAMTRDIAEIVSGLDLRWSGAMPALRVAYQAPCSLQHGQKITGRNEALLARAGFTVLPIPEGHLCCGSAGTYNILQPELSQRLQARKVGHIESVRPDLVATANIGCREQIAAATRLPVVHAVELLDWATGGPMPQALAGLRRGERPAEATGAMTGHAAALDA